MKTVLLHITLLIAFSASAQKEDLKKLSAKLDEVFHSGDGLHIDYSITVKSNDTVPQTETMNMQLFKKSDDVFKMVMGNAQTLLRDHKITLQVNHLDQVIVIQEDTSKVMEDHTMLSELKAIIDSAQSVIFSKEKDELIYTLTFKPTYVYKNIQMKFSSKTQLLSAMYAEYNPLLKGPYYSLSVTYNLWDIKWKDTNNELQINRFVEKKNDHYDPVASLSNYKVFIPEQGKLNIDFK